MKAYFKTVRRTVSGNITRFAAITCIVMLGISFMSGLGELAPKVRLSISGYLESAATADIIVKSVSVQGFLPDVSEGIADIEGVGATAAVTAIDTEIAGGNGRLYIMPLDGMTVNPIAVTDGDLPVSAGQVLVERHTDYIKEWEKGEVLELPFGLGSAEITGIAANPLIFSKEGEPDMSNEPLEVIVYADSAYYPPMPITDIYIKVGATEGLNRFGSEYAHKVDKVVNELEAWLGESAVILTLEQNLSYNIAENYTEKVNVISLIFPIFFIAVAALTVLSTMSRLVEEERAVIGCYKTLGYSNTLIAWKYIGFSIMCCLIGSALGMALGITLVPGMIYPTFEDLLFLPQMVSAVSLTAGLAASLAMLLSVLAVTLYVVVREINNHPAALLRPKSPKAGRKILLERMGWLWNRLKFKYKSTLRNVFRNVKNFVMTVVSIAGATALVLAGFGLYSLSQRPDDSGLAASISGSLSMISAVIIVFAVVLCALVIYNLTNMNIGERKREIATLKVLGYGNLEVSGYIFREIFVMAVIGLVIGLPLGFGLIRFVFAYLDIGNANSIEWFVYLSAAVLIMILVLAVDLLLIRKISKIDMNTSLKSVD